MGRSAKRASTGTPFSDTSTVANTSRSTPFDDASLFSTESPSLFEDSTFSVMGSQVTTGSLLSSRHTVHGDSLFAGASTASSEFSAGLSLEFSKNSESSYIPPDETKKQRFLKSPDGHSPASSPEPEEVVAPPRRASVASELADLTAPATSSLTAAPASRRSAAQEPWR